MTSSSTVIGTIAIGTVGISTYVLLNKFCKSRGGWRGALQYIWEGEIQEAALLEQVEYDRAIAESTLSDMEIALERARLDTVDSDAGSEFHRDLFVKWKHNYPSLQTTLGIVSSQFDTLVAQVDSVILGPDSIPNVQPQYLEDLKARKKLLSKTLVLDMERLDTLMNTYTMMSQQ